MLCIWTPCVSAIMHKNNQLVEWPFYVTLSMGWRRESAQNIFPLEVLVTRASWIIWVESVRSCVTLNRSQRERNKNILVFSFFEKCCNQLLCLPYDKIFLFLFPLNLSAEFMVENEENLYNIPSCFDLWGQSYENQKFRGFYFYTILYYKQNVSLYPPPLNLY